MQYLKELYLYIRDDPDIKNFLALVEKLSPAFTEKQPQDFSTSSEMAYMSSELSKLNLSHLQEICQKIPVVPHITAIILKACQAYTIAYLIIPAGTVFDWHDHMRMNGISRCVSGNLTIRSLDPSHFRPIEINEKVSKKVEDAQINTAKQNSQYFEYPMNLVREEKLDSIQNKISLIYPQSFNIHEIKASPNKQSSFIDLLVPEYPDNSCHYFETVSGSKAEQVLTLRKIKEGKETIIGFEQLIKHLRQKAMASKTKVLQPIPRHPN